MIAHSFWQKRLWRWIFSEVPCKKSRLDASATAALAKWHLRPDPRSDVIARQPEYRAHVSAGAGQPPELLPVAEGTATCDLRSNKLPWSTAAATAIGESPRSCTVEECRSITSGWCGSCGKTTCWAYNRGASRSPRTRTTSSRYI